MLGADLNLEPVMPRNPLEKSLKSRVDGNQFEVYIIKVDQGHRDHAPSMLSSFLLKIPSMHQCRSMEGILDTMGRWQSSVVDKYQ